MGSLASYKKRNAPVLDETKTRFKQGYFIPTVCPEKCISKVNEYRSSWEYAFMSWLDRNPSIIRWASEPIGIPYLNPVKGIVKAKEQGLNPNDPHNFVPSTYYIDFWWEVKGADGIVKKVFGEVKPWAQTQKPKPLNEGAKLKDHRRYINEANTYLVNMAKWKAAKAYVNERGCEFTVITEKTLKALGVL